MTLKKKEVQVTVQVYATDNMDLDKIRDAVVRDLKQNWVVTNAQTT